VKNEVVKKINIPIFLLAVVTLFGVIPTMIAIQNKKYF
jgi:hypothetical protein